MNVNDLLQDISAISIATVFVTQLIKKAVSSMTTTEMNRTWSQITAWLSAILLCYMSYYFQLGFFSETTSLIYPVIYGLIIGLLSNGVYDAKEISFLKTILDLLKSKDESKSPNKVEK